MKTSMDYMMFKLSNRNRNVTPLRVKKMKESIKKKDLTADYPILVNGDMEILDGQTRFMACLELGLPIYYIVAEGMTMADVPMVNNTQEKWKLVDFINSHAVENDEYRRIANFLSIAKDAGFSNHCALTILFGRFGAKIGDGIAQGRARLTHRGYVDAQLKLQRLVDVGKLTKFAKNRWFISAFNYIFKIADYDHIRMLEKLDKYSGMLKPAVNVDQWVEQLDHIYNYQSRSKLKIRFLVDAMKN